MQTGTKISLLGHGALVTWALFGGMFQAEPLPFTVQEVAVISSAEFERLSNQAAAPDLAPEPAVLTQPEAVTPPEILPDTRRQPELSEPEPVAPPPEPEPEVVPPAPEPEPEITQDAPQPPAPDQPVSDSPQLAEPEVGRPTDRVAPTPIAPPERDVKIDDVAQQEVAPDPGAEDTQPAQQETAEAAAADRIVTEAESESDRLTVLQSSPRPKLRPRRPAPEPEPDPEPVAERKPEPGPAVEPETSRDQSVNDALAEALAGAATEAAEPSGPPLTAGEKDGLRVSVSKCWNFGALSTAAQRVTVVVGVSLTREGTPEGGSLRLLSFEGGSQSAANQAFQVARRAILRCGAKGFDLPHEKYAQWRDIEMTFNPERMRRK